MRKLIGIRSADTSGNIVYDIGSIYKTHGFGIMGNNFNTLLFAFGVDISVQLEREEVVHHNSVYSYLITSL